MDRTLVGLICVVIGVILLSISFAVDYRVTLGVTFSAGLTLGRIFWSPKEVAL